MRLALLLCAACTSLPQAHGTQIPELPRTVGEGPRCTTSRDDAPLTVCEASIDACLAARTQYAHLFDVSWSPCWRR